MTVNRNTIWEDHPWPRRGVIPFTDPVLYVMWCKWKEKGPPTWADQQVTIIWRAQ